MQSWNLQGLQHSRNNDDNNNNNNVMKMTETKAKPRLASLRTTSTARVSKGWRHFTITITISSSSSSSSRERRVAECRRISRGGGRKCWRRRRGRCPVNKIGEKTLEFCPVVVLSARPFFGDYRVSQYQNAKTNVDFIEARDSEWQWHQLGLTQVWASLQTNNHASTPPLRPDSPPAAQPTASKH